MNVTINTYNKVLTFNPFNDKHILNNIKIINKQSVLIVDLPFELSNENILQRDEYLGQYGKIKKLTINKSKNYNNQNKIKLSYSVFVLFENELDASLAIICLDKLELYNYTIRASFGTNKICKFQLIKNYCSNKNCNFYHGPINENNSIFKKENLNNLSLMEIFNNIAKEYIKNNWELVKQQKINIEKKFNGLFPSIEYLLNNEQDYIVKMLNSHSPDTSFS